MSYDVSLVDPVSKEVLNVENAHFMRGGTYAVGGTNELWLNVTGNYGEIYGKVMGEDGIMSLNDKTGQESISILESAIAKLGDDVSSNYWEKTEGNAKRALIQILAMANMRPDGIWEVSC